MVKKPQPKRRPGRPPWIDDRRKARAQQMLDRGATVSEVAAAVGISRAWLYRLGMRRVWI